MRGVDGSFKGPERSLQRVVQCSGFYRVLRCFELRFGVQGLESGLGVYLRGLGFRLVV